MTYRKCWAIAEPGPSSSRKSARPYLAYLSRVSNNLTWEVDKALEFVNFRETLKSDSTVFVKPNFTFPYPKPGVTTSSLLLKSLLENLRNRCRRVILGESDGGSCSFRAEEAFLRHGMYEICKDVGVELVNLSKLPSEVVASTIQGKKVKVQISKLLLNEIDSFISVPTLKVHVVTTASLGIKNLWGCYPDTMRGLHHQNLDHKLSLLVKLLNPKVTLIDGLYGLNNHGPMYGDPVKMNLILASNNVVVADTLGISIMGLPVRKVKHVMMAGREGLGTTDLRSVRLNSEWRYYRRKFHLRRTLLDNASMFLVKSDVLAKLVMDSPLTPALYTLAGGLKTTDEKTTSSYLSPNKRCARKT